MVARIVIAALLAVLLSGGAILAQPTLFSVEVTPNPVVKGSSVKFKTECNKSASLSNGCGFSAIYQGKPGGTIAYQPFICPGIFITVGPGQPWTSAGWNCQIGGKPAPAGTYFVRVDYNVGTQKGTHYAPFQIVDSLPTTLPVLSATSSATRGATLGLKLNSPNQPNVSYVIAASLTTNTGFDLTPKVRIDLDQDALFWTSLAIPNSAFFSNFLGLMDRTGIANASAAVPNATVLRGAQLAFQAVTVQGSIIQTTNALTLVIQ
jgi:hypothetical protein